MDKKNILITGGAGFIGSNLALNLIDKDYSITVLDNLLPQIHGENPIETSPTYKSIVEKVNFIHGDVRLEKDWEKALEDIDIVYHLAAETGTGQSMYSIVNYNQTNIIGTSILLDYLVNQKHSIQKVILSSSRAVYGEGKYQHPQLGVQYPNSRKESDMLKGIFEMVDDNDVPLELVATDEESKLHPISVYGISKLNQEQLVQSVCSSIGIDFSILRYQNVYGEGQSLQNPYTGILSIFSNLILKNQDIRIFEDGLPSRDFIHINDVVEASICAMQRKEAKNKIINVGTGKSISVLEIAQILIKAYGKSVKANVTGEFRLGDIRHNKADITRMKSLLNYTPKVSIEEGIHRFTQWVLTQNINEIDYTKSLNDLEKKGLLKKFDA